MSDPREDVEALRQPVDSALRGLVPRQEGLKALSELVARLEQTERELREVREQQLDESDLIHQSERRAYWRSRAEAAERERDDALMAEKRANLDAEEAEARVEELQRIEENLKAMLAAACIRRDELQRERDTCVENYRACSDSHVLAVQRAQGAETRALAAERERDAAQKLADLYKEDRDGYDALLGRKMDERDVAVARAEAAERAIEETAERWGATSRAPRLLARLGQAERERNELRRLLKQALDRWEALERALREHHVAGGILSEDRCPVCAALASGEGEER